MFIQIISGIRAVLATLLDAGGRLCVDGTDYLGLSHARDVFQAMDTMSLWSLQDFVPNVKYWKDFPLASFLSNPLPTTPASWSTHNLAPNSPLFGGRLATFWRRLCHPTNGEGSTQLFRACFSLAQSKRGFAPVPISFVMGAYQKHAKELAIEPAPLTPEVEADLDRFLSVFFRNFAPRDLLGRLEHKEASTSASSTATRLDGGARE
jgi:hypothetical protein